jgi:hypothetical protein
MNFKSSKWFIVVFSVFCVLSLTWSIYRDTELRKQYPGDLRNRIVGSRLQMDGISPYFYRWKPSDGLRYYDWNNASNNLKISNITATPFFHQVISPVANYPQYTISKIWLACNYLVLIIMITMALRLCINRYQQMAVIFTGILFLFSYGWTHNIVNGQMYLAIPLLCMSFYFMLTRKPILINAMLAGIFAMSLILIRPTAVVFLLPFLLLVRSFTLKYKIALVIPGLLLMLIAFSSENSRRYWKDYQLAMKDHVKVHQKLQVDTQDFKYVPIIMQWEGWDRDKIIEAEKFEYYKVNGANGNVFVFLNKFSNVRTPIWLLGVLCVGSMAIIIFLYFKQNNWKPASGLFTIAIFGFILYMFTDLFSPVHRGHYNAGQWIFPLLLTASAWTKWMNKYLVIGVLTGLILNSLMFSMFPMQQSIGEYLICISLIGLLLTYKTDPEK